MVRILLALLSLLTTHGPGRAVLAGPGGSAEPPPGPPGRAPVPGGMAAMLASRGAPAAPPAAPGTPPATPAAPPGWPAVGPGPPGPRRWRLRTRIIVAAVLVLTGLIFRKAIASVVLAGLSAALHLVGLNVHLPSVRFAWPWQVITAGTTTNTDLGPWVLQKIEGISQPALGQANFDFYFTRTVSKNIGPWPCWFASTFYAVGHASATVNLNPGPAWWKPAAGHYRLQVLSRPVAGKPGHVSVTMVLPRPRLPQTVHDITIDNIPSRPIATQHSWTYPGFGCGVVLRPQFAPSVLYPQAQRIAFYKATHVPGVTRPLIGSAENEATQTIRGSFIQPTLNALGYTLDRFTLKWAAGPGPAGMRRAGTQ
ncbi:MAG: hypothetical protein QOG05_4960 [Streptosporangiaceae bacterium]|nr:hypothetical protein [Streptosporangiaceae bacterium]